MNLDNVHESVRPYLLINPTVNEVMKTIRDANRKAVRGIMDNNTGEHIWWPTDLGTLHEDVICTVQEPWPDLYPWFDKEKKCPFLGEKRTEYTHLHFGLSKNYRGRTELANWSHCDDWAGVICVIATEYWSWVGDPEENGGSTFVLTKLPNARLEWQQLHGPIFMSPTVRALYARAAEIQEALEKREQACVA